MVNDVDLNGVRHQPRHYRLLTPNPPAARKRDSAKRTMGVWSTMSTSMVFDISRDIIAF